jgi:hypothetical protein
MRDFSTLAAILALIAAVTPQQAAGKAWSEEYKRIAGNSFLLKK